MTDPTTENLPDSEPTEERAPASAPESQQPNDGLSGLRQELVDETARQDALPKRTGLFGRVTGLLRRDRAETARLPDLEAEETGAEPAAPQPEPYDRSDFKFEPQDEDPELQEHILNSRFDLFLADDDETAEAAEVIAEEPKAESADAPAPFADPFVFDDEEPQTDVHFDAPLPAFDEDEEIPAWDLTPVDQEAVPQTELGAPAEEIPPLFVEDEATAAFFEEDLPAEEEAQPTSFLDRLNQLAADEPPGSMLAEDQPVPGWDGQALAEPPAEIAPLEPAPLPTPPAPEHKRGFFQRLFGRKEKDDRFSVEDELVSGRLAASQAATEEALPAPDPNAPRKSAPATSPFSAAPIAQETPEEELPLSEDEFWERLANRDQNKTTPFHERRQNWNLAGKNAPVDETFTSPFPTATPGWDRIEEDEGILPDLKDIASQVPPEPGAEQEPVEPAVDYQQSVLSPGIDEEAPEVKEIRAIALEDYQDVPLDEAEAYQRRNKLNAWLAENRLAALLGLLLTLALIAIVVLSLPFVRARLTAQAAGVEPPPLVSAYPYPIGLRLTGGWYFNLQRGSIVDGAWTPQTSEWLDGTEIRRVVALPWSRQSEAVIRSLIEGDELALYISNNDIQTFAVDSVELVDRSDRDLYTSREPSLLIILYQPEKEERWVVLAKPAQPVER